MPFLRTYIIALAALLGAGFMPDRLDAATLRMTIQSHADMGAKCLDVPRAQFSAGMRLQTWECRNTPAQIFVYDDQTQELKIGGLCVTSWGRGEQQDAVGVDTCAGGTNQHWKMVESKDYYQITGVNNRCLELRYQIKDNGAPLDIQDCDAGRPWRLWALVEAPADVQPVAVQPVAVQPVAVQPADAQAGEVACRTESAQFSAPLSQSTTANSISTGGAACIYSLHQGPQVQWTNVSITEQPRNGIFEKTGDFVFKYQPRPGFKGQDEYALTICGNNTQHAGCATITYRTTVN
jgi:hypothetical protein